MKTTKSSWLLLLLTLTTIVISQGCKDDKVTASIEANKEEVYAGEPIQFTSQTKNATHYQWDFGDGNSSIEENPTHIYESEGNYTVDFEAIGDGGSSSATLNITVLKPFEVTIFEGVGIEGLSLGDTWEKAKSIYNSDTTHIVEYFSSYEVYMQLVFFEGDGVSVVFITESAKLGNFEPIQMMYLFPPYEGATTEGIYIGSAFNSVKTAYGTPEDEDIGDGYIGYWYDSKGIDFYSFEGSGLVDEIDIYPIMTAASTSTELKKLSRDEINKAVLKLIRRKKLQK